MDFYDSNCHQVNWSRLFAKREPQIMTNNIVEKNQVYLSIKELITEKKLLLTLGIIH